MLYDGDVAGIKAAIRGGLLCLSKGLEVLIANLPEQEDPDSLILKQGYMAMQEVLGTAIPLISFLQRISVWKTNCGKNELILDALRC